MTENPLKKEYWFGTVDPRPLALFRMLFGAVILFDLLHRLPEVRVFLSDEGLDPRDQLSAIGSAWSLFRLVESPAAVMTLYLAGCVSVAAFLVGYRTRLAQVAMFIFLASLHFRSPPFAGSSPDRVMGTMSFWLLFTDSGAVWSLDWVAKRRAGRPVPAIGLRLLQWQFGVILLVSALAKRKTWSDGLALYHIVQVRAFVTPLGAALVAWPRLCLALTWVVLGLELSVPLLLIPLTPLAPRVMRAAGVLLGLGLFLGILLTLEVGCFPELMILGFALFTLPEWLDRAGWIVPVDPERPAAPARWKPTMLHGLGHPIAVALGMAQFGLLPWSLFAARVPSRDESLILTELREIDLSQSWHMFVDVRELSNSWWSDLGTLSDGSQREALEQTVPELLEAQPESHWQLFKILAGQPQFRLMRRRIVDYACREFDRTSDVSLASVELELHEQRVVDPGQPPAPETVRVFHESCGDASGGRND